MDFKLTGCPPVKALNKDSLNTECQTAIGDDFVITAAIDPRGLQKLG
jgi:hypothetical protein